MTTVNADRPMILRKGEGFVVLPTSDDWERKLSFDTWENLCGWVEALAGQVVTVEDPAAEIESYEAWAQATP